MVSKALGAASAQTPGLELPGTAVGKKPGVELTAEQPLRPSLPLRLYEGSSEAGQHQFVASPGQRPPELVEHVVVLHQHMSPGSEKLQLVV